MLAMYFLSLSLSLHLLKLTELLVPGSLMRNLPSDALSQYLNLTDTILEIIICKIENIYKNGIVSEFMIENSHHNMTLCLLQYPLRMIICRNKVCNIDA